MKKKPAGEWSEKSNWIGGDMKKKPKKKVKCNHFFREHKISYKHKTCVFCGKVEEIL